MRPQSQHPNKNVFSSRLIVNGLVHSDSEGLRIL